MKTTDGSKIVGILLPNDSVAGIIDDLYDDSEEFTETVYVDEDSSV